MILEVYQTALLLVKFEGEFPAVSAIEHQLRVQLVDCYFLEHIVVELPELHLAEDEAQSIKLNQAFAAMSDASALDLRFLQLDEELPLASLCQVCGLALSFSCEGDGSGLELYGHALVGDAGEFGQAGDFDA